MAADGAAPHVVVFGSDGFVLHEAVKVIVDEVLLEAGLGEDGEGEGGGSDIVGVGIRVAVCADGDAVGLGPGGGLGVEGREQSRGTCEEKKG